MARNVKRIILCQAAGVIAVLLASQGALAGDFSNAADYNHGYGMNAGQENQTINPSLRDANGNLTVVNGQFTSSQMSQQSGVQQMSASGSGVGSAGTGTAYGTASAVGNSLNVVTIGNNNTVVVSSHQTNNGNQEANISLNGN
ncbi:MAG TPA: holdfast anchoring protein HfaA [Rhizomicrobium sp.]|jgi:holdfast attachment protein HfaA|nr:holdfast anchoring protein HfaA [Rhizomicrobium sp.]